MNITFFIGNGFDINIGLNTQYKDFLPYFKKNASKDNMIKGWIAEEEHLWSDLERKLGIEMNRLSDADLNRFYEDKDELDDLLSEYLIKQEARIDEAKIQSMAGEFVRSLKEYKADLPVVRYQEVEKTLKSFVNEDYIYQFIVFNYTSIIDKIVSVAEANGDISNHNAQNGVIRREAIGDVLHIHGTTESEMILGVNDISQINNEALVEDIDLQNSMIKENMNEGIGQNKVSITKSIIKNSHIIYIYGMSLGETDNMWWEAILEWLKESDMNRLIYFAYTDNAKQIRKSPGKMNRETSRLVNEFLKRHSMTEEAERKIKKRIYVLFETSIFNFEKCKEKAKEIKEESQFVIEI